MTSLVVVSTINASEADTEGFLDYYAGWSFLKLVVFLDNPDHMEYACIKRLADQIQFIPCTPEHWMREIDRLPIDMPDKQHTNIRAGARIAQEIGVKWTISVDNDEFIYPLTGLQDFLDSNLMESVETIRFPSKEAVHTEETGFGDGTFETRYFRNCTVESGVYRSRIKQLSGKLRGRLRKTRHVTRFGFIGHIEGKSAFDVNASLQDYRQHYQKGKGRQLITFDTEAFFILHYDAVNFDHWRDKWYRRTLGTTKATQMSRTRRRITFLAKWAMRFTAIGGDKALFRYLFVFSPDELQQMIDVEILTRIDPFDQTRV